MSLLSVAKGLMVVAPTIARWIGGEKAEEAAEKVCGVARAITGADTPELAATMIQEDPELAYEFNLTIREMEQELDKLFLADVQDARDMQIEVLKHGRSRVSREFIYWYAALLSLFACSYVTAITFWEVPKESVRFADTALGFILGTVLSALIQFFYGASRPLGDDE